MAGSLEGVKVVDLSRFIAGPYCGMILADMGAEVIKVEKVGGEDTRSVPPFVNDVEGDSLYTAALNRNKRAITLNYRSEEGKHILERLFRWADIVIENFRPGTLEKMGFTNDKIFTINPNVIVARCSGFGQNGPLKHRPGFDAIAQAMGGIMSMTGEEGSPPLLAGTYVVDYATGLHAAVGVLSALHDSKKSGKGQIVDVSLYESAVSMLVGMIPTYHLTNNIPNRVGNGDRYSAPVNAYKTKDGWVYLSAPNQGLWKRLCILMDKEDLLSNPQFKSVSDRLNKAEEINDIIKNWISSYTRDEVVSLLDKHGIPCAPVQNISDLLKNEHLLERKQIVDVDHPVAGKIPMSGVTIKMSSTPGSIRYGVPLVGQHNEEIYLNELGFTAQEFENMKKEGAL